MGTNREENAPKTDKTAKMPKCQLATANRQMKTANNYNNNISGGDRSVQDNQDMVAK